MSNKEFEETNRNFELFVRQITLLGRSANKMESIADSFERISDSMHTFKDGVNGLQMEPLSETRALFEAMAIIAESGSADDIIEKYSSSLNNTLDHLADILAKFALQLTPESLPEGAPPGSPTTADVLNPKIDESSLDPAVFKQVVSELQAIKQQLQTGINVKEQKRRNMFGF